MGTNYYQVIDCCDKCGRGSDMIHIGKSSAGWPFSVHIIPDLEIHTWADWVHRLRDAVIKDEYGGLVTIEELNDLVVSKRSEKDRPHVLQCYKEYPNFNRPDLKTGDKLCSGEFS